MPLMVKWSRIEKAYMTDLHVKILAGSVPTWPNVIVLTRDS